MKRLLALIAAVPIIAASALNSAAESFIENEICTASFEIKRTDPACVVKDGVIGKGEYERVYIDKDDLSVNFISSENYLSADIMANTVEWYFSYDSEHGLNFAVVFDAGEGFATNVAQPELDSDKPGDNFCYNLALNFSLGRTEKNKPYFYYSVARDITSGEYLLGHYGQLGTDESYRPVAGRDFEISYSGTVATFEWSIPFDVLGCSGASAGTALELSIAACAGAAEVENDDDPSEFYAARSSWSVSLGQFAFMSAQPRGASAAHALLSPCRVGTDEIYSPTPSETDAHSRDVMTETRAYSTVSEELGTVNDVSAETDSCVSTDGSDNAAPRSDEASVGADDTARSSRPIYLVIASSVTVLLLALCAVAVMRSRKKK